MAKSPLTFMRRIIFGAVLLSAFHAASPCLQAADGANLIRNPGFEDPPDAPASYSLFTAPDSKDATCRFTITSDASHSGKQSALMQANDFARFSLGPVGDYPVAAGDLYRVGVWVKAGPDFQAQPDSPGIVLRLNLSTGSPAKPASAGLTFVYLNNTVSQAGPPTFAPLPTPHPALTDWTHLEAVVKVPDGVDHMVPGLFFWKAKGSLFVDDFNFQKVDPSTPVISRREEAHGTTKEA
jgi:hypothetical protein